MDDLSVPSTNYAGAAWDAFGGAPDPVVDVRAGSASATPGRQNGLDDTFDLTYSGAPVLTNVRATDLLAYLAMEVTDEDVTDYELISACTIPVNDATFMGATQTASCPRNASSGQSGYVIHWHLEPF